MLYNWCVRINFGRDFLDVFAVEAYTASWIEISIFILDPQTNSVEAYTASWIEMHRKSESYSHYQSRLIQPRGLK